MNKVNSYDIDGVIYMGEHHEGLRPGPEDIIVTGRSYQERESTLAMLRGRGIYNMVFFNPLDRKDALYGRRASGKHKARVFRHLYNVGVDVRRHFEDDPIQMKVIREEWPEVEVVQIGNGVEYE